MEKEMFHFEFINTTGSKTKTGEFERGTKGLTDLGVRTMVVEYERSGIRDIKVFLNGEDVTEAYRPTKDDRQIVNDYLKTRIDLNNLRNVKWGI